MQDTRSTFGMMEVWTGGRSEKLKRETKKHPSSLPLWRHTVNSIRPIGHSWALGCGLDVVAAATRKMYLMAYRAAISSIWRQWEVSAAIAPESTVHEMDLRRCYRITIPPRNTTTQLFLPLERMKTQLTAVSPTELVGPTYTNLISIEILTCYTRIANSSSCKSTAHAAPRRQTSAPLFSSGHVAGRAFKSRHVSTDSGSIGQLSR
jgi:hypothetical protein